MPLNWIKYFLLFLLTSVLFLATSNENCVSFDENLPTFHDKILRTYISSHTRYTIAECIHI